MDKRVRFAANLANKYEDKSTEKNATSSNWYTSKEIRAFRRDISASLKADKEGNKRPSPSNLDSDITCMRGLELYASNVRRALQKHYSQSIIEAQRRIKLAKRKREEDSVLLQRLAEKFSQYAKDRAQEVAARDEVDSRRLHEEGIGNEPLAKKQSCQHTKPRAQPFQEPSKPPPSETRESQHSQGAAQCTPKTSNNHNYLLSCHEESIGNEPPAKKQCRQHPASLARPFLQPSKSSLSAIASQHVHRTAAQHIPNISSAHSYLFSSPEKARVNRTG